MDQIRDICAGEYCGVLSIIVNKKYWLCDNCNFKRLHGGKGKVEVYKERHDKKETKPDKKKQIKQISNKRAERHAQRDKTYRHIDQSREHMCEGCGRTTVPLSHSHILSEQHRPDLYANEDNIRLHCFGGYGDCHETWERGIPCQLVGMHDFKENLSFIKDVDIKRYNAIVAKFKFDGVKL